MRKWIALLLSALMLFSLTACDGGSGGGGTSTEPPDGYDAEFTIYVNGAEEWTPFPGKSDVTFAVSDDKVISCDESGSKISFTGKQVGESTITATLDGTESKALVKVREMEGEINYIYNPPNDNYCIEITYTGADGEKYTDAFAKIGSEEAVKYESSDWQAFWNTASSTCHTVVDGKWIEDVYDSVYTFEETGWDSPLSDFNEFVEKLNQAGVGNDKLSEFYVDTEKVCDIDCWVFDTKGWNNQYVKFWVDPSNGFALKMVATTTGSTYAVTEYNLNYTTWDSDFAPN